MQSHRWQNQTKLQTSHWVIHTDPTSSLQGDGSSVLAIAGVMRILRLLRLARQNARASMSEDELSKLEEVELIWIMCWSLLNMFGMSFLLQKCTAETAVRENPSK